MKNSVFATTLALGVLASSAFAADLSIKGNVSETVEGSNNYFLLPAPAGATLKSTTAGVLDIMAQTPTTSYLLDANYSYYKYLGPGAADAGALTWGTPAGARFTINHISELDRYTLAASWSRADATQTQLTQSGVATLRGSTDNYSINGGVTHDLGRNDSIGWTAKASTVSFTDPTATPYVDFTSAINWNHTLSATTTLNNSVSFDWFSQDNAAKSQRLFWSIMTGLQSQLSPRLNVSANVGVDFVNSYQNGVVQSSNPNGGFQPQVGAGTGWVGNIGLTYKLMRDTNISLTAAEAIIPVLNGALQQSESIGLSLHHDINRLSNLTFSTQYSLASSPAQIGQTSTASDFFLASVNYGYQLTRELRANLSYTYRDNVTVAKSSTILFSLSRDLTLLGSPAAINKAEQERALLRSKQNVGLVFPGFH